MSVPALILVMIAGAGIGLWAASALYGLIRKDRSSDKKRSKVSFTEVGGDDGGVGH